MKVLHFGTFDVNAGGPAMSTYNTLYGLRELGVDAQLLMYPLSEDGVLFGKNVPVHYAKKALENMFAFSATLQNEIMQINNIDVFHAQGVWQYPTYALASVARKSKKPYVITPRGMLYPQDIAKAHTFFKWLSLKCKLLNDLNRAACVHATCNEEMQHLRDLGVKSPIAVIPNPAEIKEFTQKKQDDIFRLGFLGRLSPRKNVEGLLYAWSNLEEKVKDAELLIIGGGDTNYEKFLRSEILRLDLKNVKFTGFISGAEKDKAIASLSVLAMPSEFENFGNVILEGLIRKIPCIATKGAPWQELEKYKCGWWVEYNQEAVTAAIEEAMSLSRYELLQMGKNGNELVHAKYSIEAVAAQMLQVYEWLTKKDDRPECVFF